MIKHIKVKNTSSVFLGGKKRTYDHRIKIFKYDKKLHVKKIKLNYFKDFNS